MAWNPSPMVADCREIARKWSKEQVIIIAIDGAGVMQMATYGETKQLCDCAKSLGDTAFSAIQMRIAGLTDTDVAEVFLNPGEHHDRRVDVDKT